MSGTTILLYYIIGYMFRPMGWPTRPIKKPLGHKANIRTTNVISWLHRASNNVENFSLPTDAYNVKKHRVIKTF